LEVNANIAAIHHPKPEVVISQPWIEVSHRNWYANRSPTS